MAPIICFRRELFDVREFMTPQGWSRDFQKSNRNVFVLF